MKKRILSLLAGCAILALASGDAQAQLPRNPRSQLPANFQTIKQGEYNKLEEPEVTFPDFYDVEVNKFYHDDAIRLNPSLTYPITVIPRPSMCGNGDFESGLSTVEWRGGFGNVSGTGAVLYGSFADSIVGGAINLLTSRQTWVADTIDPFVPIHTVAPTGSTHAVRIGNAVNGMGAELLSKTFTVSSTNPIATFWYALVLQSPQDHNPALRPGFRVRVLDAATNAEILGTVDLGNGRDSAFADTTNPFFITNSTRTITYRNWSCAQINLSQYIGRRVIVQFVTKDCAQSAHWGYAYIDDFCGNCKGNGYNIELGKVDCDKSTVCFKYQLPVQGGVTGNVNITFSVYQNGVLVGSPQSSGVLTSGTTFCFNVSPATLAALDPSLGGYDYAAVGNFMIGSTSLSPLFVGSAPDGVLTGKNNDCSVVQTKQCCPGTNLVVNGGFEFGNTGFTSGYSYQPTIAAGSISPGRYGLLTDAQAATVSSAWLPNCTAFNRHLIVNGNTGASTTRLVWGQQITVKPGNTYKFCGDFKNLPACGFDVKPRVIIQIVNAAGQSVALNVSSNQTISLPNASCNWTNMQQTVTIPAGLTVVQINVLMSESGVGDGNDLAVDNFSFIELQQVAGAPLNFGLMPYNTTATTYNMTATATSPITSDCTNYWEVEEMDANNLVIPSTQVINPSAWLPLTTNTFNGYAGTSTLSGSAAGVFQSNKTYRFVYGRSCTCSALGRRYFIYGPVAARGVLGSNGNSGPQLLESGVLDANNQATSLKIGNEQATNAIKVYPNPTSNKITVQKAVSGKDYQVKVFNNYGQVIKTVTFKAADTKAEISLAEYASGSYLLQVVTNDGSIIHTEKITKL